ncbi:MAG: HEPN domain-containing protein [Thermoanaerobaculia bacterium]
MLVRLPHLRTDLPGTLAAWYELYRRTRPTIELFAGTLEHGTDTPTFSFLALSQALEGLHRSLGDALYELASTWNDTGGHRERIIAGFPGDLPADLRSRLKTTLQYANEYSLRKRVKELVASIGPLANLIPGQNSFGNSLVDLRNDLTHKATDPPATYLLHHVHVPQDVIRDGVQRLRHSLHIAPEIAV